MAGMGRRFKDAGYHEEKYAIEFGGHTLLDWSLASLTGFREFQLILITRPLPGIEEILVRSANALGGRSTSPSRAGDRRECSPDTNLRE